MSQTSSNFKLDPPSYFGLISPVLFFKVLRCWLLISNVSLLILVLPVYANQKNLKYLGGLAGFNTLVSSILFHYTSKSQRELEGRAKAIREANFIGQVEKVKRFQIFSGRQAKAKTPVEAQEPATFDLERLKDIDKFPNIFLVASPGSGKSTLAEFIISQYNGQAHTLVLNHHQSPDDFDSADLVVGAGDNIGTPDDEPVLFHNLKPTHTIAQGLLAVLALKKERYEERARGQKDFKPVVVVIEEMPSVVAELGLKFFSKFFARLLMECRKVRIQFILIGQSYDVKSWGLEGRSSLRDASTIIWLGKASENQAKKLLNNGEINQATYDHLLSFKYQALVDTEVLDTTQIKTERAAKSEEMLLPEFKISSLPSTEQTTLIKWANKTHRTPEVLAIKLKGYKELGDGKQKVFRETFNVEGGRHFQELSKLWDEL